MQANQGLSLKQSTHLVMTQQLQQSIKLLQLNATELSAFIAQECEKNPFLEEDGREDTGEQSNADDAYGHDAPDHEDSSHADSRHEDLEPESEPESEPASSATDAMPEFDGESFDASGGYDYAPHERITILARNRDGDVLEEHDVEEEKPSLRNHLLAQLGASVQDPVLRRIGEALIDALDPAGYLHEDLRTIAQQLGTSATLVAKALTILQGFDPVGVGARNLAECLTLQLEDRNRLDPAMQHLLNHLELIGKGQLDALRKRCGVDQDDFKDMLAEIRALNPKPGLAFEHETTQTAEPDVIVKRDHTGKWRVELASAALPRVLVNRRYIADISHHANGADKKFITEHIGNANWLVKALDQRANTILRVASEIVSQQESFFRLGIHYLKPLTLKDIAQATGFHESTVSRVTTGKYMMTPRGLFELKYFFTSSVSHGAGGDDVSSQTVKHMIGEIIGQESSGKPLSDDDIAARLATKNVTVARRTVAKYREAMGIPSSSERKRLNAVKRAL